MPGLRSMRCYTGAWYEHLHLKRFEHKRTAKDFELRDPTEKRFDFFKLTLHNNSLMRWLTLVSTTYNGSGLRQLGN